MVIEQKPKADTEEKLEAIKEYLDLNDIKYDCIHMNGITFPNGLYIQYTEMQEIVNIALGKLYV